ncbi:MAG TPA: hypothetical protein VEQ58_13770 [Polyangiaceae bacterium]|nr:hypothetical protein [Polyangiaceae bacterium]
MKLRAVRSLLPLCALLSTLSCRELQRFDTRDGEVYCGDLVSGDPFTDGFVVDNKPQQLRMMLSDLDTSKLGTFSTDNQVGVPAHLTSNDKLTGLCAKDVLPLFDNSPVRSIPQVDHDALAAMTFGEGHDEDFFTWTDSTCQGTMLGIVSLLRNNDIELRLFKPNKLAAIGDPADKRPGFALFYMRRNPNAASCGF